MSPYRLSVDRVACDGHGLCAAAAPALVSLDRWGYPLVEARVERHAEQQAREAVAACPALALRLSRVKEQT